MPRWTFDDPATGETYTFAISPNQDSPVVQKTMQFNATTAPGGAVILFEGTDVPPVFSVQGTLLAQSQYEALYRWYNKRHQFMLTDDLGKVLWIYLTEFQPVRVRSATYPWKYTYTLSGYILSEVTPSSAVTIGPGATV